MSVESTGLAAPPVAQDPPQPEQLRFLLVEDNLVDVELVERVLRRAGFDFTFAVVQTPEDFTRELRANRPHVVPTSVPGVFDAFHYFGLERVSFFEQLLHTLRIRGLDVG